MKLLLVLACCLIFYGTAKGDPDWRAKYSPYPGSGFPQVIQASDYPTIEFIETLVGGLTDMTVAEATPEQFDRPVGFELTANALTFRSLRQPKKVVVVRRLDGRTVAIGRARFKSQPTMTLCATLFKILSDLSEKGACWGVRFVQYGTRTYRKISIVEFDFGPQIVVLDSHSNGPKEEERLYILDVIQRQDSMFWSPRPKPRR